MTKYINYFSGDKFKLSFSNIPSFDGERVETSVFNDYIKTLTVPEMSLGLLTSLFGHTRQIHPNTIGSRELGTVNVEMILDEELYNWWVAYKWLYHTRHGLKTDKLSLKGEELVRNNCVEVFEVEMLNNDKEPISKLQFNRCFLNNISSVSLEYGNSDVKSIIMTFEVEELSFMRLVNGEWVYVR